MDEPLIQALVTLAGIAAGAFGAWLQSRGKVATALAAAAQANLKVAELQAADNSSVPPEPATYLANAAPPWEAPICALRQDLDQVEVKQAALEAKQNKQAVIIGKLEVKCGLNGSRSRTDSKG